MLTLAITATQVNDIVVGTAIVWLFGSLMTAVYARTVGYPFTPLLIVGIALPPMGWVIVLFVVTIAAGPKLREAETTGAVTEGPHR